MPVEPGRTFGIFDLTGPVLPVRSRLHSLQPHGLGTPYCESLAGYITRLAAAHRVRTKELMTHEIYPLFAQRRAIKESETDGTRFLQNNGQAVNGTGTNASTMVWVLETLTLQTGLQALTMLTWSGGILAWGLLRNIEAWCPVCLQEWRDAGHDPYVPLLWNIRAVEVCLRHERYLQTECPSPDCRRTSPILAPDARPGHCARCGYWLGHLDGRDMLRGDLGQWQTWVAQAVSEMIAAPPYLAHAPARGRYRDALSALERYLVGSHGVALRRKAGLVRRSLGYGRGGAERPYFDTMLRLCYGLGISPLLLLTGSLEVLTQQAGGSLTPHARAPEPRRKRLKDSNRDSLHRALLAALECDPPVSIRAVARDIGCSPSAPRNSFPDLARAVSRRYMAYRRAERARRMDAACRDVQEIVRRLTDQGIYPGYDRVRKAMSDPGRFWHSQVRDAWRRAVDEECSER